MIRCGPPGLYRELDLYFGSVGTGNYRRPGQLADLIVVELTVRTIVTPSSRTLEDAVYPDPTPNNVRFAESDFIAVGKRCSAVRSERHLEDAERPLDALRSKAFAGGGTTRTEVFGQLRNCGNERRLLLRGHLQKISSKSRQPRVRRHDPSTLPTRRRLLRERMQPVEKRFPGRKRFDPSCCDIGVGGALALLPRWCPEPGLGGIDQLLRPQKEAVFCHYGIKKIAFFEARRAPDRFRQREAALGTKRRSSRPTFLHSVNRTI